MCEGCGGAAGVLRAVGGGCEIFLIGLILTLTRGNHTISRLGYDARRMGGSKTGEKGEKGEKGGKGVKGVRGPVAGSGGLSPLLRRAAPALNESVKGEKGEKGEKGKKGGEKDDGL